jgi:tetratricopeptide (TPR) repeat protein
VVYREQGRYREAEELFVKALNGHPHTLQTMHELAILYKQQKRYEEAEELLNKVIEGRRLKLGDTHPYTVESLNNLIDLYEAWSKPEKA